MNIKAKLISIVATPQIKENLSTIQTHYLPYNISLNSSKAEYPSNFTGNPFSQEKVQI